MVTANGSVIFILKVNSSQKYYEKMMTYLKLDESKEFSSHKNVTEDEPIRIELVPRQMLKASQNSSDDNECFFGVF